VPFEAGRFAEIVQIQWLPAWPSENRPVVRIEFLEWTESGHLKHSKFVGLREDKDARSVVKERSGGV
jgi:ATP-dependent DNA ligase